MKNTDGRRAWASDLDLKRASQTDLCLLLTGRRESAIALGRLVHMLSRRRDRPFIVVDCGSPEVELEVRLIRALMDRPWLGRAEHPQRHLESGGSLFLQDVDRLSAAFAQRLADVLEDMGPGSAPRQVPWRIMASSVEHLLPKVYAGAFDIRLFYRLSALDYMLPRDDEKGAERAGPRA
jgi:DNA-binding NtrC family response regulator